MGTPRHLSCREAQHVDFRWFTTVMERVHWPGPVGRPFKRCNYILADKGYDRDVLRRYGDRYSMKPVIARRTIHRRPHRDRSRGFNQARDWQRTIVERLFGWMKDMRRIGTRYEQLASSFRAMVSLACIVRCFRSYFSGRTSNWIGFLGLVNSPRLSTIRPYDTKRRNPSWTTAVSRNQFVETAAVGACESSGFEWYRNAL
jgi:transposase